MKKLSVKVARRIEETQDIVSFELVSRDGAPLPPFSAGAHIDVWTENGLMRQYSLCNPPSERQRYQIGVLHAADSRGGSRSLHAKLAEGQELQISAPRNHFALDPLAGRSLLLAGGIGITPLLAMAEQLTQDGAPFTLHYCSRSEARTAFRARIAAAPYADRVRFHLDDGPAEQKLDLERVLASPAPDTHLYVCGPAGYIERVTSTAKRLGWPAAQVHLEYFGGSLPEQAGDTGFEVKIASTGLVINIPCNKTVTGMLAEHGIHIPLSCEQGVCGTCITRVLNGVPDHRDEFFSEEERAANDQFLPCCSRAKSKSLLLDL